MADEVTIIHGSDDVKRYAIVRDGVVENVTLWDGRTTWTPPEGTVAVEVGEDVGIGDKMPKKKAAPAKVRSVKKRARKRAG